MAAPTVCVQTVTGGYSNMVEGWSDSLLAAVSHARQLGRVGRVSVAIGAPGATEGGPVGSPSGWDPDDIWHLHCLSDAIGWAEANNEMVPWGDSDFILLMDPDVQLAPTCLAELVEVMTDPAVGLVEPRFLPVPQATPCDLATGDVSAASRACFLIRRKTMHLVGGFDGGSFPDEGSDVDLSWRSRQAGWAVRRHPWAAAFLRDCDHLGRKVSGRDPVGAEAAKLLLISKFGGESLAAGLAAAWARQGTPERRMAAVRFEEIRSQGRLPAGRHTEKFVTELLEWESSVSAPPGPFDWDGSSLALPERVGETSAQSSERSIRRSVPFLSVIVRTQGRRPEELEHSLTSLTGQTCADFEVLLACHDLDDDGREVVETVLDRFPARFVSRVRRLDIRGGNRSRPLNEALVSAAGRYVAFLDDDDVAFSDWVERFRLGAEAHPGSIIWTQVIWQMVESSIIGGREVWLATERPELLVPEFDLYAHLRQNGTPNCGLAVPIECFRVDGVRFREDLPVFEDWDVVLRLVQLRPVQPTQAVTALYRRGGRGNSGDEHSSDEWDQASRRVLDDLDHNGFVLRGEYMEELRWCLDELDELRGEAERTGWVAGPIHHRATPIPADRLVPVDAEVCCPVMIVSPHIDDAVISCGNAMSRFDECVVLTVFAGDDVDWSELRGWDQACGFPSGINVVRERIAEDDRALEMLGARGLRLDFLDHQYRDAAVSPSLEALGKEIAEAIASIGARSVIVPLGLGHPDHVLAAKAAFSVAPTMPELSWFAYQELPYGYETDDLEHVVDSRGELQPVRIPSEGGRDLKADLLRCYRSQVPALGEERCSLILEPERYWKLSVSAG